MRRAVDVVAISLIALLAFVATLAAAPAIRRWQLRQYSSSQKNGPAARPTPGALTDAFLETRADASESSTTA